MKPLPLSEMEAVIEAFISVFPPNPTKHGLFKGLDDDGNKRIITLDGERVTAALIRKHLCDAGDFSAVGYLPGDRTGTPVGIIDLDTKNYDHPADLEDAKQRIVDVSNDLGLRIKLERSTRNGWHLHLFSEEPLPFDTMKSALAALARLAGVEPVEVYPMGDDGKGRWVIMPYAGAATDPKRLGRTYLTTTDNQPIPIDEIREWIEPNPPHLIQELADRNPDGPEEPEADLAVLEPTALAALMKAAAMPPGRFLRHASISAFMNLARRCGVVDEMRNHLKSDLVRDSWVQDGSRSPAAWNDEVDRWAAAHPAQRERGLPFLRAQGFTIPGLPTIPSNGPKKSQATLLIELALSEVSELFHDPEEEPFATLPIDKHFETHRLRSRQVKNWLQHQFYLRFKKAASSHVVQSAVDVLDAEAVFMGNTHPVFVRVGELDGSIYLDLGDPEWRAVKITPEGWSVEQEPDLKFRRPKGLAALPEPSIRGSAKGLMEFLNIIEEDWPLLLGWLLGTLKPDSPYPVLVLHGEQGSAKSTTARVLKAVVDPSIAPLRTEPRNSRDLQRFSE